MIVGHHGLWLSGAITTVLLLASAITWMLKLKIARGQPHENIDNLCARVLSWWIMAAVIGSVFWAGAFATVIFFVVVSLIALREFLAATPAPRLRDWIIGCVTCLVGIAFLPALLNLEIAGYAGRNVFLIVFLIVVTQASDVLQYVWGKLLGKHLIAPAISPSKTVEGFAGGIICATLIGTSLWWTTPFSPTQAALISLLITLFGFAGGLLLSAQKRARGIKDWGTLIRGHGGVLDRLDSLWLPAPLFFGLVKLCWT